MSHLGSYVKRQRECTRMHANDLVRKAGWTSLAGGLRRLEQLEQHGVATDDHLQRIAAVLWIPREIIEELKARDREERERKFQEWVDQPTEPTLLLKAAGLFCIRKPVPPELHGNENAMLTFASHTAIDMRLMACLMPDRRRAIYFMPDGESYTVQAKPDHPVVGPSVRFGNQRVQSLFVA